MHGAADERGGRAGGGVPDLREVRGAVPPRPRPSRRRARRVSRSQCRAAPTRGIRVPPGEDADVMWARHASTSECDPANYDRVNRKPRCMAAGCREKLTFSNRFDCKVRRAPSVSAPGPAARRRRGVPARGVRDKRHTHIDDERVRRASSRARARGRGGSRGPRASESRTGRRLIPAGAHGTACTQECGASVCLKHRFGDDHACEERRRRVEELRRRARMSIWGGREQQGRSCMKGGCRMM